MQFSKALQEGKSIYILKVCSVLCIGSQSTDVLTLTTLAFCQAGVASLSG